MADTQTRKLTPWFPRSVKPVRIGAYETENGFQYWGGKFWGMYTDTADSAAAARNATVKSMYQRAKWRGRASKPGSAA